MKIVDHEVTKSKIFKLAYEFALKYYKNSGTHGLEHVIRVLNLSLKMAEQENADPEIVALAAILHDIARPLEDRGIIEDHAVESAKIARDFLKSLGYQRAEEVYEAIISHSFSSRIEPKTIEAKIISDADKIDAIGAIGVARVFMYSGEHGRSMEESIKHFYEKILRLKNLMYTNTGKRIAEERHKFTEEFVKRLEKELKGEK